VLGRGSPLVLSNSDGDSTRWVVIAGAGTSGEYGMPGVDLGVPGHQGAGVREMSELPTTDDERAALRAATGVARRKAIELHKPAR
jgi:malate/lactate dehydrogenase